MVQTYQRCEVCNCYLDHEDLFCSNCGVENPHADRLLREQLDVQAIDSQVTFDCESCGASMAYDAEVSALACPYCGTQAEIKKEKQPGLAARCVAFQVSSEEAQRIFDRWLGRGFWRPNNLRKAVRIGQQRGVLVPYWVFSAKTDTRWTADVSPAPPGSRGDWQPAFGRRSSSYTGILVGGSNVLTEDETASLCPYDLTRALPPGESGTPSGGDSPGVHTLGANAGEGVVREQFRVARKMARPKAHAHFHRRELTACRSEAGRRSRNVRINMEINSMHGEPWLLPVWIVAYQYKSTTHRVLINGQSGKVTGSAPLSVMKILVAIGVVVMTFAALAGIAVVGG